MKAEKPLILIVDDHPPAVEMITQIFVTRGYEVQKAYSGAECLEKARFLIPSLILLDIMMPNMNGFEVLAELRGSTQTAHIPVIFITARDDVEDIEQGLLSGADDYIPKPLNPRELIARARSKIEASQLRLALQQRSTELEALLRLSEELSSHLQLDDLLSLILFLVLDLLPAEAAIIHLAKDNMLPGQRFQFQQKRDGVAIEFDFDKFYAQFSIGDRTIWGVADKPAYTNANGGMIVPLIYGEQFHGILCAFSMDSFTHHHLRVFEAVARQSTLAVRNAELYIMMVEYAERLEEMVEERTSELRSAQELLVRAEKLASVGRLAAGIAHEINNPLMPIRLNLELILEDVEAGQPVSKQDIEESLHSVKRISRIIERLQQFTRKRGTNTPDMELLDLSLVLKDVLALSRAYLKQTSVSVTNHVQDNIYVAGSKDQLEQVFLNIVLNACSAMETGGELIFRSSVQGENISIEIEDTGTGIDASILDKIFEPFVSTKETGTGLGLFISHEIVENHNGKIDVKTTLGKGTIFIVTLPLSARNP